MTTAVLERNQVKEQVKNWKIMPVTDELAHEIKTPEFQREYSPLRTPKILKNVAKGSFIPPICVADIGGSLYVLDGQHRLEARRKVAFPLYAIIVPMTEKQATLDFIVMNTTSVRVSMKHRLKVDPTEQAVRIRTIAKDLNATPAQVYVFLQAWKQDSGNIVGYIKPEDFKAAEQILGFWAQDPRWNAQRKTIYDTQSMIKCLGYFTSRAGKPLEIAKKLHAKLDMRMGGTLAGKSGSTTSAQKLMRQYIKEVVFVEEGLA